jgi:hypothetical protein
MREGAGNPSPGFVLSLAGRMPVFPYVFSAILLVLPRLDQSAGGCIACHRVPGGPDVVIGPDLRLAGAHHWPGHLRRRIADPSAFIVRGADGILQSLMPPQPLDEGELEHITAWLAGLQGEARVTPCAQGDADRQDSRVLSAR